MAKSVLRALVKTPQKKEQIPSLLVAASFGSDFDKKDGSPNSDKQVRDLKRRFEDNEADIITELYARHFKNKNEMSKMSMTHREPAKENRPGLMDDSIGEAAGFNTDIEDDFNDRDGARTMIPPHTKKPHLKGAPKVETYS